MATGMTIARRIVVSLTSISIAFAGSPGLARLFASLATPPPPSSGTPEATQANTDATTQLLKTVAADIPRQTFDPSAIVDSVGKDRAALLGWVRDQTYWVPYRGALRGPTGVLMDRLGSSLDRSLLLAELLSRAGHTVRLAQGTFADQPAREALERMRPVPANPLPQASDEEPALQRYAKQLGLDVPTLRTAVQSQAQPIAAMKASLEGRVGTQAPFLIGQLGQRPAAGGASAAAVTAFRDHWWVQLQDGNQWVDLDPTWPAARAAAGSLAATRTLAFDRSGGGVQLPAEMAHEVTLRFVVEQWKQGKVTEKTPVAHTFRPSDVYGQPIVLQVAPLGWPRLQDVLTNPDPAGALKAILLKQTEWLPSITVGERAIRQSSFTDTGELNAKPGQPMAAAAAAAASIADAFGGGEAEPDGQLTAAWIEYETRVPGRPPSKVRRDLFDAFSQQPRSAGTMTDPALNDSKRVLRALGLATAVQLLPVSSRLSREYVASQVASGIMRNRDAQLDMARRAAANEVAGAIGRAESMKATMNSQLLDLAYARLEWSANRQDVYLDAPSLLSYRTSLFLDSAGRLTARQGFDIVTNGVAIRPGAAGDPFEIRVRQGTVDTNLEDLLMRGASTGNAGALLGASGERGWVVVRGSTEPAFSRLTLPADVRARIEDQLRLGYVVIVPGTAAVAAGGGQMAWWRVDPRTGETLGIGPSGWGQSMAEYATFMLVSGALIFATCMIVQAGPRQTSAQFGRSLAQCACVGLGGGLALTVGLGGGGLGIALFILSQAGVGCSPLFWRPQAP